MNKRLFPGFYVRGRYYGMRVSQAIARAQFLADESHAPVDIELADWREHVERFQTVAPRTRPVSLLGQRADGIILDDAVAA